MTKIIRPAVLFAVVTVLFAALSAGLAPVRASVLYGVASQTGELVNLGGPSIGIVSGMQPGERVLGIDFRPATGQLYALGSTGRLYIIDRFTAVATLVGVLDAGLSGTKFGFDFDPVADRIRVVANSGLNYSVNPNDATVTVQTALNPGSPQGVAAAYTNSYKGATSTTLYIYNILSNTINTMMPPASGTVTIVPGTTGQGISIQTLDIDPYSGVAYCAFFTGAGEAPGAFGTFNLATGQIGGFQPLQMMIDSIAIMPEPPRAARMDFDRDKKADYTVYRPSTNDWFVNQSTNNGFFAARFGAAGDVLTPGDFDGDEKTDVAVWRGSTGDYYVLRSSDGVVQFFHFGQAGDEPVVRDFDGDGRDDFGVVRRENGLTAWYRIDSSTGTFRAFNWGLNTDRIAPADYDGDGKCDLAVRRGSAGQPATFYIMGSTAGYYGVQWGLGNDAIVPGDFDGDGKSDVAVVRLEEPYVWYILNSSNQSFTAYRFGAPPHIFAPGDYDGDGRTDPTVFVPAGGTFYTLRSSSGSLGAIQFGQNGDVPPAKNDVH